MCFILMFSARAGIGYVLQFSTPSALFTNTVLSENFTIAVGPTVAMVVLTQPDHAYGGSPFYEQPVVALVVSLILIARCSLVGSRW